MGGKMFLSPEEKAQRVREIMSELKNQNERKFVENMVERNNIFFYFIQEGLYDTALQSNSKNI